MTRAVRQAERTTYEDSDAWTAALRGPAAARAVAIERLHALLLRAARFELTRRRASLAHLPSSEVADLATQAADDALMAILAKLDSFRGESRFTTWAYKFALLEAGVKARRRDWQGREVTMDDEAWSVLGDAGPSAQQVLEQSELIGGLRAAVATSLTAHQRDVFTAVALNGVPIDVLAERLGTTRGALYKTLHDARRKLRSALAEAGLAIDSDPATGGGS